MKGTKEYRFTNNPKEQEFHDKFIQMFDCNDSARKSLSAIVNGWLNDRQNQPKEWLSEKEEVICVNLIQWLGSPVGQGFLAECGFDNVNAHNGLNMESSRFKHRTKQK